MGMWREEDPILNDAGMVIKGGMWQHQRDWWNSTAFIKALVIVFCWGKTLIQSKRAIAFALQNLL